MRYRDKDSCRKRRSCKAMHSAACLDIAKMCVLLPILDIFLSTTTWRIYKA